MNVHRLAALGVVLACATSCKTSTPPTPEPLDTKESAQELPAQWLVWSRDDASETTSLIDADGKVLATAPGIWLGTEDNLWSTISLPLTVRQTDCDCEMQALQAGEDSGEECVSDASLEVTSLEPIGTGSPLHVPTSEYLANDARSVYSSVDGNVGPYVFATSCIEEYTCGAAHGGTVCAQWIWDLRTQEPVDRFAMSADPLRGEALLQFVRDSFEDEQEAAQLQSEDLQFTWVAPIYEAGYAPRMEEQYTAPTCYACSDGAWDSYTVSTRRTVGALPKAVSDWLEAHPAPPGAAPDNVSGWTQMPADAKLREQFLTSAK